MSGDALLPVPDVPEVVLLVELLGDVLDVPELGLLVLGDWVPVVLWPAVLWLGFADVDGDCGLLAVLCAPAMAAVHTKPVISRP